MNHLVAHIKALRPHQWVKNAFVLASLIFSGHLFDTHAIKQAIYAFFAFSFCASAIYLINDITDYERDLHHPKKKNRPIASGAVKRFTASIMSLICLGIGLSIGYGLNQSVMIVLISYFVMNLGYSYGLKHVLLLDVFLIACGFLMRVMAGAFAIEVKLSPWLLMCTLLIALFLGFCKRRHERSSLGENAAQHRAILDDYSLAFLDKLITITASSTVMSYALYTIDPWVNSRLHTNALILTLPLVLFGVFRYLYLVYQADQGGSPTQVVLKDRGIQLVLVLYLILSISLIYFKIQLNLATQQI